MAGMGLDPNPEEHPCCRLVLCVCLLGGAPFLSLAVSTHKIRILLLLGGLKTEEGRGERETQRHDPSRLFFNSVLALLMRIGLDLI